jgi:hypothetical protein
MAEDRLICEECGATADSSAAWETLCLTGRSALVGGDPRFSDTIGATELAGLAVLVLREGWEAHPLSADDDRRDQVVIYCPRCAGREFHGPH